ncbi:cell surface protein SprA [Fodinibius salinus]|uniref:Cell surface protein SprA n=1 Tax=Fodinibius salinus TaxID=860790 RepID=A0A5D3YLB5_9BACT|nr:cell surface protein SprA [Fodinibius salinus]TYP94945.1 cell surface protein SprA [Fodinibius salinus]
MGVGGLSVGVVQAQDTTDIAFPTATDSLPRLERPSTISYPYPINLPKLFYIRLSEEQTIVERDSTGQYISYRLLFGLPVAQPYVMDFKEYKNRSRSNALQDNWDQLIREQQTSETDRTGLLDFKLDLPAAEESAFSTIFGKPEVNLSINGTANMNVGATIQKTENTEIPEDQRTQVDPTFEQSLKLNIQGTIGDKLSIQTDWDTERDFDFMNRLNIVYDGYDDEILQRLELGNVSMQTGNSLVRGGSALFGVKSVAQIGSLELTSVLSQQEGEGKTETITGGAQEKNISIRPGDYESDRHFFLDFFTRQQFEENVSDPQQTGQALQLTEVNVWALRESSQSVEGERQAIALGGLGVSQNPDSTYNRPNENNDNISEPVLDQFRDPSLGASASDFGVNPSQFVEGYFVPLQEGVDYSLRPNLGYISLKRNLGSRQALAISFKYRNPQTGQSISVGDVSPGGGNRIYLKLIRPQTVTTSNQLWDLMMKNVYSMGVSNITQDGLEFDIKYTEQNVPSSSLPGRNTVLLQDLGLDRVDQQGSLSPDNNLDFSTTVLNPAAGLIVFPYLQPFGDRIEELLAQAGAGSEEIFSLSFTELYNEKKVNANQESKNNFYLMEGTSKGSVSSSYSLGYSLVEGSVTVLANGRELQEGTDYAVDYSIGSITILNDQYLKKGQEIKIEYENNQLTQIGQKSFTGVRAEYQFSDNITLGSTYFRLKEKPLQDKIRIGDEPINNSVIGFDANAQFDTPWLTRLVDKVPLLQTKARSSMSFSGEFARLKPGISQTGAVEDAIEQNRLFEDEENGLSFIDDFEGSDIGLSFLSPSRWSLAAAPAAVPGYAPDAMYFDDNPPQNPMTSIADKAARSDLRSQFAWYTIPQNIDQILGGVEFTPESEPVQVTEVFPNRDVLTEENFINTLDVHYNPTERGPYNYNNNLRTLLEDEPERTWGGMTTTLPSGQEDLTQNNIEFLEFWVQSVLPGGKVPTAKDLQDYDGKIYIDVGVVSEDVVPNFKTNTEDGLVRRPDDLQRDNIGVDSRSYLPIPPPAPEGQFSNETQLQADVGLDGAPNTNGIDNKNEQNLFSDFINVIKSQYGNASTMASDVQNDPSNDDYTYYGESEVEGRPLHQRFHRMYGYHEGNSPSNSGEKRAVTNEPDTEGLITQSIVEQNNAYFQYEIDWNPANLDNINPGSDSTFVVDMVDSPNQEDRWFQVRVPLKEWARKVGGIENFQNISYIRVWLSGYEKPFTLRFATFELVGSQWRPAENVDKEQGTMQGEFNISSVNIEENSQRQPIPYRKPEGAVRATDRGRQRQTVQNEQSIVMNLQNLAGGELKMMKRVYPGGLNMINYSNVRMFVHGEGYDNRSDAELVMRFGTDLTNNYYEYRQPITPTDEKFPFSNKLTSELDDPTRLTEAEEVWLYDENSMNILLRAFNELKQLRDQQGGDPSTKFERSDLLENAPSGTRIAVKGNPSLDRVGEIGMGIHNPFDPQNPSEGGVSSLSGQFWFNELRVSGYDNQSGWAATAKGNIEFADFASVSANVNRETDGFGSLDSGLGQRRMSDLFAYDVNTTLNLHKFIPERYGWNIPVTLSTRQSSSTPRYLPNQGDVRLSEFKSAVHARDDIDEEQKDQIIDQRIRQSQTVSESYSINVSNVSKSGSNSTLAQYTLDKTTLNYVYNTTERRNPEYSMQDNWNYSGSLRYDVNFQNTLLFRPLGFLGNIPILHPLAGLQLGYTPASINASVGIDREYDERLRRFTAGEEATLQQSHSFTYNTEFGFGYNLTPSIKTTFRSRSVFDLSQAGVTGDTPGNPMADSTEFRVQPSFDVLRDVAFDTVSARRSNYQEAYTASWQPRLNTIDAVSWVNYSANYSGGYQWRNSPRGSQLGATVSNNFSLNQTLDFDLRSLLNRMDWYSNLQNEETDSRPSSAPQDTTSGYSEEQLGEDLANIGKKSLAAILSLQSLDVSFNISKSALQNGYSGGSTLFDMFNSSPGDFSPPFSYRTGVTDNIGRSRLIDNPNDNTSLQLPSNRNLTDDITVGARFAPFDNFTIDLTWNTEWKRNRTKSITIDPNQSISSVSNQNGMIGSSVWAFGGGYSSLFREQLSTAFEDINNGSTVINDSQGNNDGESVLGRKTLQNDFRRAYLGAGKGAIGNRSFTPFPMPNWRITWTGIESFFPLIGDAMSRASITHNYKGQYRLGWVFNSDTSLLPDFSVGAYSVSNPRPEFDPNSISVEKKFSPLLGLNITWNSGFRTNFQYEYSQITSLALSNSTVIERLSKGIKLSFAYTLRDFKIPLFPRVRNAIDITINGSLLEDKETKYELDSDLGKALSAGPSVIKKDVSNADFSGTTTGGQKRINGSAIIGYQFSQTVKANFEYNYNRLIPKTSGVFGRTDHDIRFNIVVSIRSN